MESSKNGLDLEKELTCSICTELLYQPLTLLDCLHTFCGACLKEWFSFQDANALKTPTLRTVVFTCPSCRAAVRDTRHNATVVTLLDMLVSANPEKARTDVEKKEMAAKYMPGDRVLPKTRTRARTPAERRADEADESLLQEVREASLHASAPHRARRHRESRSAEPRSRSSRDRRSGSAAARRRSPEQLEADGERRRSRRSESRQRQVEHQSSIRSLISSADLDERDIEKEIEDFAKQIQEEGLLEGLDLDNIDLSRNDELSRRITEAYRRRQRDRARPDTARRRSRTSSHGASHQHTDSNQSDSRHLAPGGTSQGTGRSRTNSRSASATGHAEDRSRPPTSMSANLEPLDPARRPRRRTASGGRSATAPVLPSAADPRPGARSQTDLPSSSQTHDPIAPRSSFTETRSLSTPSVSASAPPPSETERLPDASLANASFADRLPRETIASLSPLETPPEPVELAGNEPTVANSSHSQTLPGDQRTRSQVHPEPSITCSVCDKPHIEYDVHYNCSTCSNGEWNLCLNCYRTGQGCQYWFGFGYAGQELWEKTRQKQGDKSLAAPHLLTARRYLPRPSTSVEEETSQSLTDDDPKDRLQLGTFCARCLAWANACYWRCDSCNDGEWGFCNDCVTQGRSCSHMLLPLTQEDSQPHDRPNASRPPSRPAAAAILTVPQDPSLGTFKPLTFKTPCSICQDPIPPSHVRYHCFQCTSSVVMDAPPGDYENCTPCYQILVDDGRISGENGFGGWRRCLEGHRMVVIGFADGRLGQWRYVERDLVGGRVLHSEAVDSSEYQGQELLKWSWKFGDQKWERLVSQDVAATAPKTLGEVTFSDDFPPDGGMGTRATAKWAWYPPTDDSQDLMFPRGAVIGEVENINGDWMCGTYMGADGTFPAPLVVTKQDS